MITKDNQWNLIVSEMRTIHRLNKLTQAVMKKIEEMGTEDVKNKNE